jgi:hypothetical protein
MINRGQMFLVNAQRSDGAWISFRTCDRSEAERVASSLGVSVATAGR